MTSATYTAALAQYVNQRRRGVSRLGGRPTSRSGARAGARFRVESVTGTGSFARLWSRPGSGYKLGSWSGSVSGDWCVSGSLARSSTTMR
jgi:hypothetical protein